MRLHLGAACRRIEQRPRRLTSRLHRVFPVRPWAVPQAQDDLDDTLAELAAEMQSSDDEEEAGAAAAEGGGAAEAAEMDGGDGDGDDDLGDALEGLMASDNDV